MNDTNFAISGAAIFDGTRHIDGQAVLVQGGKIAAILPVGDIADGTPHFECNGGVLAPGFVDLQVNGGGGVLFNNDISVCALSQMSAAHASLGATSILPTLITDNRENTRLAIEATIKAIEAGIPGIAGLHLEGPHLSEARRGAHDPALIRPMDQVDVEMLVAAAARLPVLKVTLAPENVDYDQIKALSRAGIRISLGHTDAEFEICMAAADAGATCVTHLFNAMSQMTGRKPGLVGAALENKGLSVGLIADLDHVHASSIALAIKAKQGPGQIFLVSDAMATAGSNIHSFTLNGRMIERHEGRLTLADGTLAGAHLDLPCAIRNIVKHCSVPFEMALAMVTSIPARVAGSEKELGHLAPGRQADIVHLDEQRQLSAVWQQGQEISVFRD